jgi:hypothetical protein
MLFYENRQNSNDRPAGSHKAQNGSWFGAFGLAHSGGFRRNNCRAKPLENNEVP